MSAKDTLDKIDALLGSIEHHYQCEQCGRWFVLRPDSSKRAKVECPCGGPVLVFNLAHPPTPS